MPSGLLTPASWVAMFHRRYAHKFGTTAEQLGHVAISIRDFAVTNPRAFFYQRPPSVTRSDAILPSSNPGPSGSSRAIMLPIRA